MMIKIELLDLTTKNDRILWNCFQFILLPIFDAFYSCRFLTEYNNENFEFIAVRMALCVY